VTVLVEISPGELIDKITILKIKRTKITDTDKRRNVEYEYQLLMDLQKSAIPFDDQINVLQADLQKVNEILWQIEDDIRDHEKRKDFGPSFIALARSVYHQNDRRAATKRQINDRLHSAIIEEKSYTDYQS